MNDEARTAGDVAADMKRAAIELLERWTAELRAGTFVVEAWDLESPGVQLPLRASEPAWVINASTGALSLTMQVRVPAIQRRYAEQLLERL